MTGKTAQGWITECPALDADNQQEDKVIRGVKELQEKYRLGDAHMYRSSENSYHIYLFYDTDRDREETLEIIKDADFVDEEFKEFQEKRDKTRMRVKGKHKEEIEQVKVIESQYEGQGHPQRAEHLIRTFNRMKKV